MKKIVDVVQDGQVVASIEIDIPKASTWGKPAPDAAYIEKAKNLYALFDPDTQFAVRDM